MSNYKAIELAVPLRGKMGDYVVYQLNGKTVVRSRPHYSKRKLNTPLRRVQNAQFAMIQKHIKFHGATISQCFDSKDGKSARNSYYAINGKYLNEALAPLAARVADAKEGRVTLTLTEIEHAISEYAKTYPQRIVLVDKQDIASETLKGAWPQHLELHHQKTGLVTLVPCREMQPEEQLKVSIQQ